MTSDQERIAILFIHGILGTTSHFEPFLSLVPPNWSICNLSLKGHGGSVKDFSQASMTEWKQQVKNALEELSETNNKIIIVAHSMGTLFAIQEAIEKPVDELFLLNVMETTLIISKKPGNTGISRDIRTEFTTDLLLSD